jgi:HK97 family phage major capsid protein
MSNEIDNALIRRIQNAADLLVEEPARLGLSRRDIGRYNIMRALRCMTAQGGLAQHNYDKAAGFELECSREIATKLSRDSLTGFFVPSEVLEKPLDVRAMATQPGSKGGFAVGAETMSFIDILRARSVAYSMGAFALSGLQGNLAFPRQTAKVSVTWQGADGTSVGAADQTLGQTTCTPKTVMALTDVSEQLIRQTGGAAEAFIFNDLAKGLAIDGIDAAVINGTGATQPLGIKNTTGITSGQDSAAATLAKLLAFVSIAGTANAIGLNPGWITNTAGAVILAGRQRFTSTDSPLWLGSPSDGTLTGYKAMSSEQLASANLIFCGDWDDVAICDWGVLELQTSRGGTTRFNQAQVGIRALWMVDVLFRYPSSFIVSTNLS